MKILKRAGVVGTVFTVADMGYDVYEDGQIKTSNIVNGSLMIVGGIASAAFPPLAVGILLYNIEDYAFDISGAIDDKFGQVEIFEK